MSDKNTLGFKSHHGQTLAKPLYIQRLEASLNVEPFMSVAQELLSHPLSSSDDSDSDANADILAPGEKLLNGIITSKCGKWLLQINGSQLDFCFIFRWISTDRQNDKLQIYNLSQIGTDRKWLQDILLSDTETDADEHSDEDEYIREMLKDHVKEKKVRAKYYQNPYVSIGRVGVCMRVFVRYTTTQFCF